MNNDTDTLIIAVQECPRKVNFGIHERSCNLSCPKCLVHSDNYPRGKLLRKSLGSMNIQNIIKVFEDIRPFKPVISPSFWSEPLLNKKLFIEFCKEANQRGIPVSINTNALLIDNTMATFLVNHLEAISISIDATTKETLIKTRSTDKLDKIIHAINMLLNIRGDNQSPRIIVSFSEETCNLHEKESFIDYWITKVDAVRINKVYSDNRKIEAINTINRSPCREIFDSMTIDFDGTARMCCLDGYRETSLGNVFQDGILNVWKGKPYYRLRLGHEKNGEVIDPFCKDCDQWAGFNIINEYEDHGILMRETAFSTYYNRLDRLDRWSNSLKRNDAGY